MAHIGGTTGEGSQNLGNTAAPHSGKNPPGAENISKNAKHARHELKEEEEKAERSLPTLRPSGFFSASHIPPGVMNLSLIHI